MAIQTKTIQLEPYGLKLKFIETADGSDQYALVTSEAAGSDSTALGAGTNRSGTVTTGGTDQQMAAANTARRYLRGQNISTADLWINETGQPAAVNGSGSYRIPAGGTFSINTNQAVRVLGGTTGQQWTATEG